MMAAMLKSVAFPLSPFVGIPLRARDDTYSYAFNLSLLRSSYSDRSDAARLSLLLSRFPRRFIFSPSRGPPLSSLPQEKSRAPSPSLGTRHAKVSRSSFASFPLLPRPSSPFCHQVFLRLDMLGLGRGASASFPRSDRERGIPLSR